MSKQRGFVPEVMACARRELERAGFKKRETQIFTRALDADTIGWVGLNKAFDRTERVLRINPVMGFRHQPLEQLVAELCGEEFHPFAPPTISRPLGYLTPEKEYRTWDFDEGEEWQGVAADMVGAINDYGLPFMLANADPETLTASLRDVKLGIREQSEYRLPALLYLLRRREEAAAYLRERLSALSKVTYPAADHYRRFARTLLDLIAEASP